MDTVALLDGVYLGAAIAELKGDIAVGVDGAFVEQSYAVVWAEDRLFKVVHSCPYSRSWACRFRPGLPLLLIRCSSAMESIPSVPTVGSHNRSQWIQEPLSRGHHNQAPIPAMTSNLALDKQIEKWVTMLARGLPRKVQVRLSARVNQSGIRAQQLLGS